MNSDNSEFSLILFQILIRIRVSASSAVPAPRAVILLYTITPSDAIWVNAACGLTSSEPMTDQASGPKLNKSYH
jgi:hypothetical protein